MKRCIAGASCRPFQHWFRGGKWRRWKVAGVVVIGVVEWGVPCYPAAMKFTLLTHFKEFDKRSNTGQLVLEILGEAAEQVQWDRLNPPPGLVEEIESGGVALVYPGGTDDEGNGDDLSGIRRFILIDGTWHQARKIHQRSPYLRMARRVSLTPAGVSQYNLRKNQKEACLCTAECVIEILRGIGMTEHAEQLRQRFLAFIRPPGAMRGEAMGS